MLDSLLAAEQRLRGGASGAPEDDADEATVAAWRAAMGVPEAATEYSVELPDGMVLGEAEESMVNSFLEAAHAAHLTPAQVGRALAWYFGEQDAHAADQSAQDEERRMAALAELRDEWGPDFMGNVNFVEALLDDAPAGFKDNLLAARMADGTLLGDNPEALRWLRALAREARSTSTLAPGLAVAPGKAIADEIKEIERRMAEDREAYFKDEAAQARYRDLIERGMPKR